VRPAAESAAAPASSPARPADDDPVDPDPPTAASQAGAVLKEAFIAAIGEKRPMVYGTMVAQARRIDLDDNRVVFRFGPNQTMLGDQVAQEKAWLEELATGLAGRRITVTADVAKGEPGTLPAQASARSAAPAAPARDLKAEAMRDPVLQSLLDVIPAEVKDITELK